MTKRVVLGTVVAASSLVLAACGSSGGGGTANSSGNGAASQAGSGAATSGGAQAGGSLTDVTVGLNPFSTDAPIWYAEDSGTFKKYGLNLTTHKTASPIATSAGMASGKFQFGFITTPVLINANVAGQGMQCVAPVAGQVPGANSSTHSSYIVASKKSGIKNLKGFSGKTFGVIQLGSINRLAMQVIFDRAGATNVKYVAIPFPQMSQALASGRIDGATISNPWAQTALKHGATALGHPNSELYAGGTIYCFAANTSWLKSHPKVAQGFRDGMKEAILYAKDHKSQVLTSLVKHLGLSKAAAQQQKVAGNYVPKLNTQSIAKIQSQMKKFGWIKKTVDPSTMVWEPSK